MNRDSLRLLVMRHEGLSLKPYKDSLGLLTIGYGRCLQTEGITESEAGILLDNDLANVVAHCRDAYPWFNEIDDSRQNVVCSMVFNLGWVGFAAFKKMIAAVEAKNFAEAANQMLMSGWAGEVGTRAAELAAMMRDGDIVH